jgi:hypothetical protein
MLTRYLVPAALLLCCAPALAWDFKVKEKELTLDVTETFVYTYHWDNGNVYDDDDNFHQILNTLDVNLSHEDLRVGARLDANLFASSPADELCPDPLRAWCGSRYEDHFAAERLYLIWARPELDFTVGDFYASLGRGLALNVVKIDELGQDITIRGGKLVYHDGGLGATVLAGFFNPLDVDNATATLAPWEAEPVMAGRLEYSFFEAVLVGAHAVYIPTMPLGDNDHNLVWGMGVELPNLWGGNLGLVAEVDVQRTTQGGEVVRGPDRDGGADGLAAYASATLTLGDVNLLGEFKYYDNFELRGPVAENEPYTLLYHHPPTLERITADIKSNSHISGGRLRVDYNIGELGPVELILFANFGYFESWEPEGVFLDTSADQRIMSPFGGLELSWMDGEGKLQVSSGVRRTFDAREDKVKYRDIHVEVDVEQPIVASHSLKLTVVYLDRLRNPDPLIGEQTWRELDSALSYKWSPHLQVAFTFERMEDPLEVPEPINFYGGSVRYFIDTGTYINLRVGENRGGIKCYLGTCRYVPPFAGAELSGVVRF